MRSGPAALALLLVAGLAARAGATEWTLIDVRAHLLNDGRVEVVETHHVTFAKTGDTLFRQFGLGTDQQIVLHAVTRTGPDGEPHRLTAVDEVHGPDQFRYYERGHVHFSIPTLGDDVPLVYRFEYELVNGVTPAWGLPSGEGSWEPGVDVIEPWRRLSGLIHEWREAVALGTTWRFDHDVLMPSREGPGYTVKQIDYHLEYDSAWRQTAPATPLGQAVPNDRYRARVAFAYLGTTPPAPAAREAALIRAASIVGLPLLGVAAWLLAVLAWRAGGGGPIDRAFVDTRFLSRTPEELGFAYDGTTPSAEAMLNRLIGQGAIQARPAPEPDDPEIVLRRVELRLLAPAGSLAPLEQEVVADLFGDAREATPELVAQRYKGTEFDPQEPVDRIARQAATMRMRGNWSLLSALCALGGVGGFVFALTRIGAGQGDAVPILAIACFAALTVVAAWPKAWWTRGRPIRGLLVSLVILTLLVIVLHLTLNRPFPPLTFAGISAAALLGYLVTLLRSRAPDTGLGRLSGDVYRMRRFARRELRRPRPQLEDGWIPRLRAIGLGRAIERWRAAHVGGASAPPDFGGAAPITTAHFSGVAPPPWDGPRGWLFGYAVFPDDEDDEDDEDDGDGS
jgi:hypothetical protein